MTNVVPLHPEPTLTSATGIPHGLHWRLEVNRHGTRRLVGFWPARPNSVALQLKVELCAPVVDDVDLEVLARVLSDGDTGAADLMAAAIEEDERLGRVRDE